MKTTFQLPTLMRAPQRRLYQEWVNKVINNPEYFTKLTQYFDLAQVNLNFRDDKDMNVIGNIHIFNFQIKPEWNIAEDFTSEFWHHEIEHIAQELKESPFRGDRHMGDEAKLVVFEDTLTFILRTYK